MRTVEIQQNFLKLFIPATLLLPLASVLLILGCQPNQKSSDSNFDVQIDQDKNLLAHQNAQNSGTMVWMHEPEEYRFANNGLEIMAVEGTDFFNDPVSAKATATAPFLYREIEGDFVATVLVEPDFSSLWNAVCLMVHLDSTNWIKFAFENSDATGNSIVTVVTRGVSDDANGVIMEEVNQAWLRLIRKENNYAMHWSRDGKNYKMARLAALPPASVVKIGIEAQCPVGPKARHLVHAFYLENRSIKDLRKGE